MNRAQRRHIMKTVPGYKKALKSTTEEAVKNLEMAFKNSWEKDDETLNEGKKEYNEDWEDEIYND